MYNVLKIVHGVPHPPEKWQRFILHAQMIDTYASGGAVQGAVRELRKDVVVAETAPGGMGAYRTTLTQSLLFKFLITCSLSLMTLSLHVSSLAAPDGNAMLEQWEWIGAAEKSAVARGATTPPKGVQFHAEAQEGALVGQPLKHRAADLQVPPTVMRLFTSVDASCISARVESMLVIMRLHCRFPWETAVALIVARVCGCRAACTWFNVVASTSYTAVVGCVLAGLW